MVTMIIYINEDGIVDSDYGRILEFDIKKNQIHLLGTSRSDFLDHEEKSYKEISEWASDLKEWKLILVDDVRTICNDKAENCQSDCTLRGRNPYHDFEFSRQIGILSGHIENPVYTAVPPQEFYLVRTRADAQSCPRDVAYDGNHAREVQGLPTNIRYMVYDFPGRGKFLREECEWKLFFGLWLLARDEIAVDWMDVCRIYRMEIGWDEYKLSDFIEELRQQLVESRNELKSSEIPVMKKPGVPEANMKLQKNEHPENSKKISKGKNRWGKGNSKSSQELLVHLLKTREEIEAQGYEAFREIRSITRSIGLDLNGDSYEKVLKNHYESGNESLDYIEDEIRKLSERQNREKKAFGSIIVPVVEGFIIIIVSILWWRKKIILTIVEGLILVIVFTIVYSFSYLYSKRECGQESKADYMELSQKVDAIISKKLNWINIQFDKMRLYKAWINQKYIQKCAVEKDNLIRLQALSYESDIAHALAFCDKLDVFSKKSQKKARNGYRYLGLETERFYYPAGWMERQCACDVQGQKVRCPYYFLNYVRWKMEYGE